MTGEDRKLYSAQILRLSALRGWSDLERVAKSELCDALIAASRSPEHAKAIIDAIITLEHYVPTPARIIEIAQSVPPPNELNPSPSSSCPECGGTGWRHFWGLASYKLDREGKESGRAVISEIQRPANVSPVSWDVNGPQAETRLWPGQHIYEFVSPCSCKRS